MLENSLPSDCNYCPNLENSLDLEIVNDLGDKINLPVTVKTLTNTGATLDMRLVDNVFKNQMQKEQTVVLRMNSGDGGGVKLPGKILWTRNHKEDLAVTLGLEMKEPLPLSVRHALEAVMPINAKDMKGLWDYWDETHESSVQAELSEQGILEIPGDVEFTQDRVENFCKINYLIYWIGFSGILSGFIMQLSQLEYLNILGLFMMFGGSLAIALKSIMSMWQRSFEPVK